MTDAPQPGGVHSGGHHKLGSPRGLLLTTALMVSALPAISAIRDPDFWWHLRAGQLIVDHRGLLGTDPFTYTATSHHWTMHEWLTEVMFAALHAVGGLALIVVLLCAVTWLGIVCVYARARLRNPGHVALALGTVLAAIAGYPIWGPRAQMITFALSCVLLLIVERHLRSGGRAIWWLVPLFLVWGNLHSGFIIGLGFLAVVMVAEVISGRIRAPGSAPRAHVRRLMWVLAACVLATTINPNGPSIILYPFATQGSAAQQTLIQEWHSPNFHQSEVLGFEVMLLSLIAMAIVNRRMPVRDLALVTVTTLLAFQSVRHIALFVAASTPSWIDQASMLGARIRPRRPAGDGTPARVRVTAFLLVVTTLTAAIAFRLGGAMTTREGSAAYARDFPVCAASWLAQIPGPLRIFNQYGEGGFLSYMLSARGDRVFIFGDAGLMGDQLLVDYTDAEQITPRWQQVILGGGTDIVLFDRGAPLSTVLEASHDWTRVYLDSVSEGFVPTARRQALHLPAAQPTCQQDPHTGAAHA